MAYFIGTALADFPIASVADASASSGIILGARYYVRRRTHSNRSAEAIAGSQH